MSDLTEAKENGLDAETVRAWQEQDKERRRAECFKAIQALLDDYGCELEPVTVIRGGRVSQVVDVVARE